MPENMDVINQGFEVAAKLSKDGLAFIQKHVRKMRESKGDDPAQLLAAGKICELFRNLPVAISLYKAALNLNSEEYEAQARLTTSQIRAGLTREALDSAVQLTDKAPEFKFKTFGDTPISAMSILGDALIANDSDDLAMNAFKKALEYVPEDGYAAGRLAQLLIQNREIAEAAKLKDKIEKSGRFDSLLAVLNLSANDPNLLPAIGHMESVIRADSDAG